MLGKHQQDFYLKTEKEAVVELLLYNDDFNTFDYVIECLVEACNYSFIQAEQYAVLVHYRGKSCVKQGLYSELLPMYQSLSSFNLTVELKH